MKPTPTAEALHQHTLIEKLSPNDPRIKHYAGPIHLIELPFHLRQKSRFKHTSSDQHIFHFFLERGTTLLCGEHLISETGLLFKIIAAPEAVTCVRLPQGTLLFARCCYHLGNRHVPLEITTDTNEENSSAPMHCLRFQEDNVLTDMLVTLGAEPANEFAPFQPEKGAYAH